MQKNGKPNGQEVEGMNLSVWTGSDVKHRNTNVLKPYQEFKGIDGKTYKVEFDFAAMLHVSQEVGLMPGVDAINMAAITKNLMVFLEAGLKKNHPDITEDAIIKILHVKNLHNVMMALRYAMELAITIPEDINDLSKLDTESSPQDVEDLERP